MDTRVRVTRMLIENSFTELLKTTPLRKITVTKICENARINRVTFYKHYPDVFDLYEKMVAECIDRAAGEMERKYKKYNLKEAVRAVFRDIFDNREQYLLLFSENIDGFYRMKSIESALKKLSEIEVRIPGIDEGEYASLKTFLLFGGGGILFSWMQEGMRQSPEEIAETLYGFIGRMMRSYAVEV